MCSDAADPKPTAHVRSTHSAPRIADLSPVKFRLVERNPVRPTSSDSMLVYRDEHPRAVTPPGSAGPYPRHEKPDSRCKGVSLEGCESILRGGIEARSQAPPASISSSSYQRSRTRRCTASLFLACGRRVQRGYARTPPTWRAVRCSSGCRLRKVAVLSMPENGEFRVVGRVTLCGIISADRGGALTEPSHSAVAVECCDLFSTPTNVKPHSLDPQM